MTQKFNYFNIPINVVVYAKTLEEARIKAALFMPWTTDGSHWNLGGHQYLNGHQIDHWAIDGVDSDEQEAKLIELGYK